MGKHIKKQPTEVVEANKKKHTSRQIPVGTREKLISLVSEMYIKGFSYRKIANEIDESFGERISIVTVGNYVKRLITEWKQYRVEALDDIKTVELQRINKLENTYWNAWERSMDGSTKTTEKQRAKPGSLIAADGTITKAMNVEHADKSKYTEETYGDPRFLNGIQWCISMRCKILGIEAPIEFKGSMSAEITRTTVFKTRSRNRPE